MDTQAHPPASPQVRLPQGVRLKTLTMHQDERGCFSEVFRQEWDLSAEPLQWGVLRSRGGILRGVHLHLRHTDYIVPAQGRTQVGLCDLRPFSATKGLSLVHELDAGRIEGMTIPPGVAHGFYHPEDALLLHASSHYYDPEDEIAIRWDDSRLGIPWTCRVPSLGDRDREAPGFDQVMAELGEHPLFADLGRQDS